MPSEMHMVTDQMNRQVLIPGFPTRIVSLVPSQTELLFHLGVGERVIGVTKFCIHPEKEVKQKAKIGGTKNFNLELIDQLQPDLIIGNKEENYQEGIAELSRNFPVWMSDIENLADALQMIREVGALVNRTTEAEGLAEEIERAFANLDRFAAQKTAYLIWRKPYMVAGMQTFIHDLMQRLGLLNVFADKPGRYPEISTEELQQANPDLVLLSSEPYPFAQKHVAEIRQIVPEAKIVLADGEMFSWYGSRLAKAPAYFSTLRTTIGSTFI